jgi:hypothetical protein
LRGLSIQDLLLIVISAGLLYVLMYIISHYGILLLSSEKAHRKMERIWPKIEVILWITYGFAALVYLLNKSPLVTGVLFIGLAIAGWRYWRDLIYGIVGRIENRINLGDHLSKPNVDGDVQHLGLLGLRLKLNSGDFLFVRYRNLDEYQIRKVSMDSHLHLATINLRLKADKKVDVLNEMIYHDLLELPYVLVTRKIAVNLIHANTDYAEFRAVFFTQNAEDAKLVELAMYESFKTRNQQYEPAKA